MLITGIGSIKAFRAPHPSTTITAAGTSDFTTRVTDRKLNKFPRLLTGFNFENFSSNAFG